MNGYSQTFLDNNHFVDDILNSTQNSLIHFKERIRKFPEVLIVDGLLVLVPVLNLSKVRILSPCSEIEQNHAQTPNINGFRVFLSLYDFRSLEFSSALPGSVVSRIILLLELGDAKVCNLQNNPAVLPFKTKNVPGFEIFVDDWWRYSGYL